MRYFCDMTQTEVAKEAGNITGAGFENGKKESYTDSKKRYRIKRKYKIAEYKDTVYIGQNVL